MSVNHQSRTVDERPVTPPRTPEEAVRVVKEIVVPVETFVSWIAAIGAIPTQFGAAVYLSLNQHLNMTIDEVARHTARPPL